MVLHRIQQIPTLDAYYGTAILVLWYVRNMFNDNITRGRVTVRARCDYYFPLERGAVSGPGALA